VTGSTGLGATGITGATGVTGATGITGATGPIPTLAGSSGQLQVNNGSVLGAVASGTSGQALISAGAGVAPSFGTLSASFGGTGQTSYTIGDILFASTSSALSKLADVATGNALISGGVGVAPSYGKIGLTTHVSGTLAVANGGTGATTLTANNVILGNGTSAVQFVAPGTNGNVLTSNGTTWTSAAGSASLTGVTQSATPFETALGHQAGNATTGANNTWVGYQAGLLNSTGISRTGVGYQALDAVTTGSGDVAVGASALGALTTGSSNVAIGTEASAAITTASNSVAIGHRAAYQYTGSNSYIAIGTSAFSSTGGLVESVGIGNNVGRYMTSGQWNVFIGFNAAGDATRTAGQDNVAIGYLALNKGTGSYNVAVGSSTLLSATTAASSVAVGYDSLRNVTSAAENTAVGGSTLRSATTGGFNVAVGRFALTSATTGASNTAIGQNALFTLTVNSSNVAVGQSSLYFAEAPENTAVGRYSGSAVTSGGQNTFVGYNAGYSGTNNLTTGSNNILIGNNAAASAATVSNEITFGNASITKLRVPGLSIDWDVNAVPFRNIPQNSQSAAYTAVIGDSGKHILHPSADTTARTFTIPANGSVAYPIGTALTFVNQNGAGTVTIAITTDTMRLAGAGTTGSRTLAANGVATAIKITSTEWIISGTGLT
jgi:hypothetical protein